VSRTEYARNGDVHLAYQVLGVGERDVLFLPGGTMPMESLTDHPKGVQLVSRLRRLGRLILTDQRGIGQSDACGPDMSSEDEGDDLAAVLDAADAREVLIVAGFDAGLAAIAYAARQPARLHSLVLVEGFASLAAAQKAFTSQATESMEVWHEILDGERHEFDMLTVIAPSEVNDERWRAWYELAGRRGASPRAASSRWSRHETADLTDRLPHIAVPTLFIHHERNAVLGSRHARECAAAIPRGSVVSLPGGDNLMYAGDVDAMLDAVAEFAGGDVTWREVRRVLATLMFTDIVGSTGRAASVGDARWNVLLDVHDSVVRQSLARFGGRLVNTTGDGILAIFEAPGEALRCAASLRLALEDIGISIRSGVHVGEVEQRGADVGGIAVHIAARVMAHADAGDVLASSVVPQLVVGSGIDFDDRGEHELRGVPGAWRLYAARV
jgi:class 3 adenylate cyclase